jgi:tetratricopeptide (TPR) repeat protein
MEMLDTIRNVNVNYLYSYVSTNSIVRDRESMITNYRYQLRSAQNALDALNKNIETLQSILDNYKNDEIFVSMQESDTARATKTTTDYYNRLIMEQADNYGKVARLEIKIADLQYKLDSLSAAGNAGQGSSEYEKAAKELEGALAVCRRIYNQIREQFEEIHESTFFTEYAAHTVAQGRTDNFLRASAKKMVIGGAAGVIVACGLWFLSALAMEFRSGKDSSLRRKEAADDEA